MSRGTAIVRKGPSVPVKYLKEVRALTNKKCLDYGSGRGADASYLNCASYDPYWGPVNPPWGKFDVVLCSYVLNVVSQREQNEILYKILAHLAPGGTAYITVRRDLPKQGKEGRDCWQRYVELDLPIEKETTKYCIYRMKG